MADGNLLNKESVARREAERLDHLARQLSKIDGEVDTAIAGNLFTTMQGNVANRLRTMYDQWDGDLRQSATRLTHAAQLLREQAQHFRHAYDDQVRQDKEREDKERAERESQQAATKTNQ